MKFIFLLTICIVASRLALFAQPGTLDLTFGGITHVSTNLANFDTDQAQAVAQQPDGKIILAGLYYDYNDTYDDEWSSFVLIRYLPTGEIDNTFDGDGKVYIYAPGNCYASFNAEASAVLVQPDGKILAGGCGEIACEDRDWMLARVDADGSKDYSFGNYGIVITDISPGYGCITSLALQSDNKIVAVGYTDVYGPGTFAIARYNPDGSTDTSFGDEGILFIDFGNTYESANAVVIQNDDKILVAGYSNGSIAMARLMPDGSPDTDFGVGGKVITDVSPDSDIITCAAIQSNGRIVVAGRHKEFNSNFLVARYLYDGTIDSSFATNGVLIYDLPSSSETINAITIQPNGRIIVAGQAYNGGSLDFSAVRIKTNGTVDNSFGLEGLVTYDFNGDHDYATGLLVEPDENIIVSGTGDIGTGSDFSWIRLNPDGIPQNLLSNGTQVLSFAEDADDYCFKVLVQPDDKVIEIGHYYVNNNARFAICRFMSNGIPDAAFGDNGRMTYSFSTNNHRAYSGALQVDGKIIILGCENWDSILLVRVNADASIDETFGNNGVVKYSLGPDQFIPRDVVIQSDGKILIAAEHYYDLDVAATMVLARFSMNGEIDSSFGDNGKTSFAGPYDWCCDEIYSLALQPDGKIIAAGAFNNGFVTNYDFILARFLPSGELDDAFGSGGIVITNFDGNSLDYARSVVLQPDGKIVCAGSTNDNSPFHKQIGLARYNSDGSPDFTFGMEGRVITDLPGIEVNSCAALLLPDNKIVVAGTYAPPGINKDFVLAKYHNSGQLDESFGVNGFAITDFYGQPDEAYSLGIQSDGKIIAGGYAYRENIDFGIARYLNDIAVSTETLSPETSLTIFPNPASDVIKIHLEGEYESEILMCIYSIEGEKIISEKIMTFNNQSSEVAIHGISSGMYIVCVTTETGNHWQKLEVVR